MRHENSIAVNVVFVMSRLPHDCCLQSFTSTVMMRMLTMFQLSNDVIIWKRFTHHWPFVRQTVPGFPHQKGPLVRSFDVFFDVRTKRLLNKKSSSRWFVVPSWSCDVIETWCIRLVLCCCCCWSYLLTDLNKTYPSRLLHVHWCHGTVGFSTQSVQRVSDGDG